MSFALPTRQFVTTPGVRQKVPLWIGLYGPSGGGKTYTALRLAAGIQQVQGGEIYGVDTEAKRMLHYADKFQFHHTPFEPPYGSLDYIVAIQHVLSLGRRTGKRPTIIIDSMSHEHEGPGGMLETQDAIVRRMATDAQGNFDAKKAERVKMLAWSEPKQKRRQLINTMLGLEANFILCFRAKESTVPVQKVEQGSNGRSYTKTEVVNQGFVPIGGDEFIYECTLAGLLMPGARGVPTFVSTMVGERKMIKVPEQFQSLEGFTGQLDETVGRSLAEWTEGARGGDGTPPQQLPPPQAEGGTGRKSKAEEWLEWFEGEVSRAEGTGELRALEAEVDDRLQALKANHPKLYTRARGAMDRREIAIDEAR
jgi:hypothetical protein